MDDQQLLRYSRQIMLPQIDFAGQQRLLGSRVLINGLGGLGSPVAIYLAAAGVGELILVDYDRVELTNLQRQILHTTDALGELKVDSACRTLAALNPECNLQRVGHALEGEALTEQVAAADLVVECSDNFTTRFAINRACVHTGTPLVSGAAIRFEGQVSVFDGAPGSPCYRCLYPAEGEEQESCSESGVLAPLVGVVGSLQAVEAIKLLTGVGQPLSGRLMLYDALQAQWRTIGLRQDPACPVCAIP